MIFNILRIGFLDFLISFFRFSQWVYTGAQDIKLRYRKSILGPWWITISTGILILFIGILWASIFKIEVKNYLLYFSIGFIIWQWMSGIVLESSQGLFPYSNIIKQVKISCATFALRLNFKNLLILAHNFLIIILVSIFFKSDFSWNVLLVLPSIFLVQLILVYLSIIIMFISTRFPDISQIIAVSLQLCFFITPIIWKPDLIPSKKYIYEFNPIYNWVEIIRGPLMGEALNWFCLFFSFLSLIIIFLMASYLQGKYKFRVPYWL